MPAHATGTGEVSPPLGPDATVGAPTGPLVCRAVTGADIPDGLVDTLVDTLLRPCAPHGPSVRGTDRAPGRFRPGTFPVTGTGQESS